MVPVGLLPIGVHPVDCSILDEWEKVWLLRIMLELNTDTTVENQRMASRVTGEEGKDYCVLT